jgi:hypothetical protein
MEHEIHARIGIDHLENVSPPRAINDNIFHRPSLLVSHIKKGSFARRHRSLPIQVSLFFSIFLLNIVSTYYQHFPIKNVQSNEIIHTNIRASRDNINSIDTKLSKHNKHVQSVSSFESLMMVVCTFFFNLK